MKEEEKIYSLILIALLTVSAYFLADTVDALIGRSLDAAPKAASPLEFSRPVLEPRRELSDYASILERGLKFDSQLAGRFVADDHWIVCTYDDGAQVSQIECFDDRFGGFCFVEPVGHAQLWQQFLGH